MVWLVQIVELLNIIYCLAELLEFAAFIRLRMTAPDMKRCALAIVMSALCAVLCRQAGRHSGMKHCDFGTLQAIQDPAADVGSRTDAAAGVHPASRPHRYAFLEP